MTTVLAFPTARMNPPATAPAPVIIGATSGPDDPPHRGDLGSFLPEACGRGVSALRQRSGVVGTFLAALELTR